MQTYCWLRRIVAGMEGKPLTDGKAKSLVAYHEVGHAVCGTLTAGHDAVQKVTLIPRGQARGLTWFIPGEDPTLISKQQIFARIVGALGGRAAEEIIFGDAEVTSGASGDLQQVGSVVRSMLSMLECCWTADCMPSSGCQIGCRMLKPVAHLPCNRLACWAKRLHIIARMQLLVLSMVCAGDQHGSPDGHQLRYVRHWTLVTAGPLSTER